MECSQMRKERTKMDDCSQMTKRRRKMEECSQMTKRRRKMEESSQMTKRRMKMEESSRMMKRRMKMEESSRMMKSRMKMEECSQMMKRRRKMEECSQMMKRKTKMEVCSVILPLEILIEILLKLPVKSLARFKCVSKSWLSLISDPSFARSHYDLALAPTHRLLLSSDRCRKIASIDVNPPLLRDYTTEILKPPIHSYYDYKYGPLIIGSCRGFMLFLSHASLLYIWNPCTRVQRIIPSPPMYVDPFLYGFGYDSSTDDYLVTLVYNYKGSRGEEEIRVVIFSVRVNEWKQFDGTIPGTLKNCDVGSEGALFFNGAIHWLSHERFVGELGDVIVAFDLTERVFFEIALPDGFEFDLENAELYVVIGGFLSVCPDSWDAFNDKLLVMEEYNRVQSSWKCLRLSDHLHHHHHHFNPLPLCVTVGGDIIAIDSGFRELMKLNGKGEVLERRDYRDYRHPGPRIVYMHTHTLLSLPCQAS